MREKQTTAKRDLKLDTPDNGPQTKFDEMAVRSAAYAYALLSLQKIFSVAPTERILDILAGTEFIDSLHCLFEVCSAEPDSLLKDTEALLNEYRRDPQVFLQENLQCYTNLFFVPGKKHVPLWASAYLTNERLLYSEHSLWVKGMYRQYGFENRESGRLPDDHLACELDFLAQMSDRLRCCSEDTSEEKSQYYLDGIEQFLSEHVRRWVPLFIQDVREKTTSPFYQNAAAILQRVCSSSLCSSLHIAL
jgi:TorA maturation chaperone TorD